jgi:hypothetical protein
MATKGSKKVSRYRLSFPDCQVEGALISYTQLTQEQRYQIQALWQLNHSQTEFESVANNHPEIEDPQRIKQLGH